MPLVSTEWARPIEEILPKDGVPTMFRRWCTRKFKVLTAKSIYRTFKLDGITQQLGICHTSKGKRASKFRFKHLSEMSYADPKKWKMKSCRIILKIFDEFPIYDFDELEQIEIMEKYGVEKSPNVQKFFGCHGCLWCPYRPPEYYIKLRDEYPELYTQCEKWRKLANTGTPEDEEYYWYNAPLVKEGKTVNRGLTKKKLGENPEYIRIM
jgi:3'-phosphoadenosine 5'-phosphosulfate sulfotransferase (PAPS reductase)/FAD synthetase